MASFVGKVLGSTETVWHDIFRDAGKRYQEPKLVLFTGATPTACGTGRSAMGPFYCPPDQKVYIDLAFYRDLKERFHAPGEFAQAYVIAHEVGHHIQNLLGISDKVQAAQQRSGQQTAANQLSVRLELQADCFAGAWMANASNDPNSPITEITQDDLNRAVDAAIAVGDDRIQQASTGRVDREAWTHGSSAQRKYWMAKGYSTGDPSQCDTFASGALG